MEYYFELYVCKSVILSPFKRLYAVRKNILTYTIKIHLNMLSHIQIKNKTEIMKII